MGPVKDDSIGKSQSVRILMVNPMISPCSRISRKRAPCRQRRLRLDGRGCQRLPLRLRGRPRWGELCGFRQPLGARPLRPFWRPFLTEFYLCNPCSYYATLWRHGRGQGHRRLGPSAPAGQRLAEARQLLAEHEEHVRLLQEAVQALELQTQEQG
jgi:hypothetical protein